MDDRMGADARCKGKTPSSRDPSYTHKAESRFCSLGKIGGCKCAVHTLIRSRSLPRARWVARIASAWDHPGCICGFAGVAVTSVAATSRPIAMPGGTLKRLVIRLLRATTLLRDG